MHPHRTRGFTLVEAVICLAVASLLLGVAIPAFNASMARADAAATRAALLASLTQAIRHSALTGTEVVLCPGGRDGCRDTFDWSGGWIVYADTDGNRRRGGNETLVRVQPALSGRVRLLTSKGRRRLVFQPTGGNAGSNATFTLCTRFEPGKAVTLVLANSGRLRAEGASRSRIRTCNAPGV